MGGIKLTIKHIFEGLLVGSASGVLAGMIAGIALMYGYDKLIHEKQIHKKIKSISTKSISLKNLKRRKCLII
ncbi:hypothetical protein [Methanosarcina siciliae]|uniref:hypothetical protein n=1 Tax=Methanosarcina siciliae TaxID=38027 RepID=UPI00064E9474|nr:hypothetical protein [Methanosarcina siciliae]